MLVGAGLEHYPLWTHRELLAAGVLGCIAAEMLYRTVAHRRPPSVTTTLNDSIIFAINLIERGASMSLRLGVFLALSALAPRSLPTTAATIVGAYVLIDLIYYWKHRLFHATRLGWALHATHHSSESLTMLATFRLNWIEAFTSYYFFAPLCLLGFDPVLLLVLIEINDGWQFVCHTELRTPIPWLDRWFNTPNIHRVHHSADPALVHKNFGSTLMLWDRLFGTYHPGLTTTEYGLGPGPRLTNVLSIQFGPLLTFLRAATGRTQRP